MKRCRRGERRIKRRVENEEQKYEIIEGWITGERQSTVFELHLPHRFGGIPCVRPPAGQRCRRQTADYRRRRRQSANHGLYSRPSIRIEQVSWYGYNVWNYLFIHMWIREEVSVIDAPYLSKDEIRKSIILFRRIDVPMERLKYIKRGKKYVSFTNRRKSRT